MDASFFEREVRCGYCISEQMKKVWACELDLLKKLLEVCNKHGLKCWADAGTLIGTVRDKGFIPWDDDIDMAMMREDYDKLVQIANQEFREPYFFQTIYSDKHYNHRHAQLRNSNTTAVSSNHIRRKYNQGIFIDIFILDTYPKEGRTAYKKVKRLRRLKALLKLTQKVTNHFPDFLYNRCRWDIMIFKKYENVLRTIPLKDTEYVSCMSLNLKERIRLKSDYQQTEYMDFEDIKIPVPCGYDRILQIDYGDYMTPIQAPTIHGKMIYDTEHSYKSLPK